MAGHPQRMVEDLSQGLPGAGREDGLRERPRGVCRPGHREPWTVVSPLEGRTQLPTSWATFFLLFRRHCPPGSRGLWSVCAARTRGVDNSSEGAGNRAVLPSCLPGLPACAHPPTHPAPDQ